MVIKSVYLDERKFIDRQIIRSGTGVPMDKNFKENIKIYYNQDAARRNRQRMRAPWKRKVRKNFYKIIKQENKKTLLELGAGAGFDSLFFMRKGLNVTAVDISDENIRSCREKGIEAYALDFYKLSTLHNKFDCIYALNTLLHVPKDDLHKVLQEIGAVLNRNGLFYLGLYGGNDEETDLVKSDVSDAPRLFTFYSAHYLKTVLTDYFHIVDFKTFPVGTHIFHSIILRKM